VAASASDGPLRTEEQTRMMNDEPKGIRLKVDDDGFSERYENDGTKTERQAGR